MTRRRRSAFWGAGMGIAAMVITAASGTATLRAQQRAADRSGAELAAVAVGDDTAAADDAITELRRRGPAGHAALLRAHREAITRLRTRPERTPASERLRRAIDRVSGQRDGHASGLYWHTDLDAARREAVRRDQPILSLRLLGRLDEEMSCANSRYFRVVLYSDPEVAARLAEHYVLHWHSERPAPRITIDMGDGRQIVRTITGNSVHYVLDAEGRPVDAIVGLYAPDAFLDALAQAEPALRCGEDQNASRETCLAGVHRAAQSAAVARWDALRLRDGSLPTYDDAVATLPGSSPEPAPSAAAAMPLTISKMIVETPALGLVQPDVRRGLDAEPSWLVIGTLAHGAAPLDGPTRALLVLKTGAPDVDATATALAESAIADGARNELLFRRRIHAWFAAQRPSARTLEALNTDVYAELMLTPASDPWLGLRGDSLYDAIER